MPFVPPLQPVEEDDHELRFRYPWSRAGWFAAFVGVGLVAMLLLLEPTFWPLVAVMVVTLLLCVLAMQWRDELVIEPASGTWHRMRGMMPPSHEERGTLAELRAVELTVGRRRHRGRLPWWRLALVCDRWPTPLTIAMLSRERDARAALERYARRLGCAAVDRTGRRGPR